MRVLYVSRGCTIHDRRFLREFVRHDVATAHLSLGNCAAAVARTPLPKGVALLGDLDLRADASTVELNHATARFVQAARAFRPSLILAGPVHDAGYIAVRSGIGAPVVLQSWAFDVLVDAARNASVRARSRVALRAATALFADSDAVVRRCEQLTGEEFSATFQMPWGVELGELQRPRNREAVRKTLGLEGRTVFLCTRGMEPVYGVQTVLESFRQLHKLDRNAALLWTGDGSLRPSVESFVRKYGLGHAVHLVGNVVHDRVLDLFSAADCYISCAASDGTSISLLEAMFCGLLVVVSDVGGNPEWVRDRENGWLVPHRNPAAFAQAMATAASLPIEQRQRVAAANRALVDQRADWETNFPGFVAFLSRLASR